jgi:hypothetical protein
VQKLLHEENTNQIVLIKQTACCGPGNDYEGREIRAGKPESESAESVKPETSRRVAFKAGNSSQILHRILNPASGKLGQKKDDHGTHRKKIGTHENKINNQKTL